MQEQLMRSVKSKLLLQVFMINLAQSNLKHLPDRNFNPQLPKNHC